MVHLRTTRSLKGVPAFSNSYVTGSHTHTRTRLSTHYDSSAYRMWFLPAIQSQNACHSNYCLWRLFLLLLEVTGLEFWWITQTRAAFSLPWLPPQQRSTKRKFRDTYLNIQAVQVYARKEHDQIHKSTNNTVASHVEWMDEMAMHKRVLKGKLYAKRRIGRPRLRWTDDVTDDLRKMGIRGWTQKARNRDQWRLIVKEAKAHPGL